jgi:acyl-CoA reductase-like NAD-dependent aldehyde dehydrogenase
MSIPNEPRRLPVRNPYTGEVDYEITPPTAQELARLCADLRAAQVKWSAAPLEHRIEVMLRWADELDAAYGPLSAADFTDTGGCLISLMAPRIVASSVRSWAADAPTVLTEAARSGTSSIMPSISFRTQLVPYPLVGVISPWNGPLMLSCLDPVPALFAGSAVIVKPSEVAPRFTEPLLETIRAVPGLAEVFTFITGDGQTGQQLIGLIDLLCFTGSVPNGRKVAVACAERLIPAYLELGGTSKASGGHFMRPTVLTEVSHDMLLMLEESFAPFMPVMRFRTEDEAVALANDTHYGLSASVIAGTPQEAARIGERLNAGTVALQDTFLTLFKTRDVGTNSFADSGLGGDRTGPGSILRFLRKKALMTQSAPPAPLARPAPPPR